MTIPPLTRALYVHRGAATGALQPRQRSKKRKDRVFDPSTPSGHQRRGVPLYAIEGLCPQENAVRPMPLQAISARRTSFSSLIARRHKKTGRSDMVAPPRSQGRRKRVLRTGRRHARRQAARGAVGAGARSSYCPRGPDTTRPNRRTAWRCRPARFRRRRRSRPHRPLPDPPEIPKRLRERHRSGTRRPWVTRRTSAYRARTHRP